MIGIIGLGFVGGAMLKSFTLKDISVCGYDKFKNEGNKYLNTFEKTLECTIIFLCLPTLFNETKKEYNKTAIYEVCGQLVKNKYTGLVAIKSTIEPETTNKLSIRYPSLKLCHNPEFLTARTAFEDFHNQKHVVLGKGPNCTVTDMKPLIEFYSANYPLAEISKCSSLESESMKIMCNSFYASKIMIFNEYYALCQKNNSDYNKITELMLKNGWINPMHVQVPGPDGKLGYGGSCFPKDTQALSHYMKSLTISNKVLEGVIEGNEKVRDHNTYCAQNL
jgi:UDPglucose 6-dehydrogenase